MPRSSFQIKSVLGSFAVTPGNTVVFESVDETTAKSFESSEGGDESVQNGVLGPHISMPPLRPVTDPVSSEINPVE